MKCCTLNGQLSILRKAAEPEHASKTDSQKDVMVQSLNDAGEILTTVPGLGFSDEDACVIGLGFIIGPDPRD
jgi:hypothetical protein